MADIRATFFQECDDQLTELESGLIRIVEKTADTETVNAVFRAVHSIKGGAGIFALDDLVGFAHVFETTLDAVRSQRLVTGPNVMNLLLAAADTLTDLVRAAREDTVVDAAKRQFLFAKFTDLNNALKKDAKFGLNDIEAIDLRPAGTVGSSKPVPPTAVEQNAIPGWVVQFRPLPELYAKANEALLLLRELGDLGNIDVAIDKSSLPDLAELDPEGAYLAWKVTLTADCDEAKIRDVFEFVEGDCDLTIMRSTRDPIGPEMIDDEIILPDFEFFTSVEKLPDFELFTGDAVREDGHPKHQPLSPAAPPSASAVEAMAIKAETGGAVSATIRVDLDRVDRLIDLVGELVINEAMLSQRVLEAGIARASGVAMALEELEHLTREIQDSVMAIRAQPVRSVFQRMPRLVRELASQTGKQVRLVTEGEGTEVDKTVIERIADPLTHMIRNAIDHGLESSEDRIAAGKPAEGVVRITALHRSGRIVLEVADDGAGINRARVKAKAVENGLLAPEAQLNDDEIDNLIFLPGFSTASTVSNISGRGVGMDVVRQSVQALGGRISIASRPGLGSTFSLSLPLTLAVLDGMVVRAAGHTLIIPLGAIIETLKPKARNVHPLDADMQVLSMRGGYIPLVDVARSLGYSNHTVEPQNAVALLVEGEGGIKAVLLVDAIDGQRQVVIKSLEANYRAVPGIAAATVMGDGRVALILDVDALVSVTRSESGRIDSLSSELTTERVGS